MKFPRIADAQERTPVVTALHASAVEAPARAGCGTRRPETRAFEVGRAVYRKRAGEEQLRG